jgi:hypothetical protein
MNSTTLVCQTFGCASRLVLSPAVAARTIHDLGTAAGWQVPNGGPAVVARVWGLCQRCQVYGRRVGAVVDPPTQTTPPGTSLGGVGCGGSERQRADEPLQPGGFLLGQVDR